MKLQLFQSSTRVVLTSGLSLLLLFCHVQSIAASELPGKWISLFNGKDLKGWTASENKGAFRVEDGCIVADGGRSHLFYTGKGSKSEFTNFELELQVLTTNEANSGVYFHTSYQEAGWPSKGYEVQVMNSPRREVDYKKTGSLYGIRNVYKSLARDNEWFTLRVMVVGKRVKVFVNGVQTVDYTEPGGVNRDEHWAGRLLSGGTFALQCHSPGNKVYFRNIRVKPLDARASIEPGKDYFSPVKEEQVTRLIGRGFPLVDFHVHMKGGVSIEDILDKSMRTGIFCGIAPNCGVGFPIDTNEKLEDFYNTYKDIPIFLAMQAEGREWVDLFEKGSIAKYDYVFTDAMTFTTPKGNRTRLWIDEEVEVEDPEEFMEYLVGIIEGVLDREKIDIHVNPTFLPSVIADRYDELWTMDRMERVANALARNNVALEINARYRLPGKAMILLAKEKGVKFAMGTNNGDEDYANLDYCLEMIDACNLEPSDMFLPVPEGKKPIQIR